MTATVNKQEIGPQLFIDGENGIYIPQRFAKEVDRRKVSGVDEEIWDILEEGPDNKFYWEAWAEVEDCAIIYSDDSGYFLYLYGDLWLIPKGMTWSEKIDFYDWPEERK